MGILCKQLPEVGGGKELVNFVLLPGFFFKRDRKGLLRSSKRQKVEWRAKAALSSVTFAETN
jgi:hypothetical protein